MASGMDKDGPGPWGEDLAQGLSPHRLPAIYRQAGANKSGVASAYHGVYEPLDRVQGKLY